MIEPTDEILLEQLKNDDTKCLGILYERYKTLLFNYFLRILGDYDISNDLLMQTFERIYKYRKTYRTNKKVRPWIYQIASNLVKDEFNRSNRLERIELSKIETAKDPLNSHTEITHRNQQLQEAMEQLNPSERQILNQYYLLEMSYEVIAESEGISVNNARIKVCRALKKLKSLLKSKDL